MAKFLLIAIAIIAAIYLVFEFVIPFLVMVFTWLFQLLSWAVVLIFIGALIIGFVWLLYQHWLDYNQRKAEQKVINERETYQATRKKVSALKAKWIEYLETFVEHVNEQKRYYFMSTNALTSTKMTYINAANIFYEEKEKKINDELEDLNYIFQKHLDTQYQSLGEMKQITRNQQDKLKRRLNDLKENQIALLSSDFEEKYTPKQWVIWEENPWLKKIYNKTPSRSVIPWGANAEGEIRYEHVNKKINVFKIPEKRKNQLERLCAQYLTDLFDVFQAHTKRITMTIVGDDDAGVAQKVFETLENTIVKHYKKPMSHFYEERKTDWEQDFSHLMQQRYESDSYLLSGADHSMFYKSMNAYEIVVFFFDNNTTNDDLKILDDMTVDNRFLPIVFYQEKHEENLQKLERYESVMTEVKSLSDYDPLRKVETNE